MSNPASFLLEFLSRSGTSQQGEPFPPLFAATVEMEEQLSVLGAAGYSVEPYSDLASAIRAILNMYATNDLATMVVAASPEPVCTLSKPEMHLLKLASDRLDVESTFDEARIRDLESLLTWVTEMVRDDASLDPHLALFITQAVSAIKAELADFSITREFALRDALVRLIGLIRAAEGSSTEPDRWKEGWDSWGIPITQGLIVSLPQLAIGAAQLLKAISA